MVVKIKGKSSQNPGDEEEVELDDQLDDAMEHGLMFPEMVFYMEDTAALVPYENNPRHNDKAVDRMVQAIKTYGFVVPILVEAALDAIHIVDGHLRYKAALAMGMTKVPVIDVGIMSLEKIRTLRLVMNKSAEWAEWDLERLAVEFEEILDAKLHAIDGAITGFTLYETQHVVDLFAFGKGLTDPDELPPDLEGEPITIPGDVWAMGNHILVCGDPTEAHTVAGCLGGAQPHLMVSEVPVGTAQGLLSKALERFSGSVAYIWHNALDTTKVQESLEGVGFVPRSQIVWPRMDAKPGPYQHGRYMPMHDGCWYAVRSGKVGGFMGDRKQTTVWKLDPNIKTQLLPMGHRPVELFRRPMLNSASPGQPVYVPYCGHGAALIAGEMCKRSVLAIEPDPQLCDLAVSRWQRFTGQEATA